MVALSPLFNPLILMSLLGAVSSDAAATLVADLAERNAGIRASLGAASAAIQTLAGIQINYSETAIPDQVAILGRILMSGYLVLGFSAHSQSALIEMVVEKEKKIKEGLLMQGLSPTAFWFSIHIVHTIYAAVVCALIAWVILPLFPLSNPVLIFLLLFFLDLSNISSTLAFAPFFNTSKAALLFDSFISLLLFTVPIVLIFWLEWAPSEGAIIALSVLFYPLGFFFGMLRVNQLEMEGVGANWENSLDGRGIGGFLIVLGLDCLLYMAIALYFDQVVPQEYGVPRPWWFPLKYIHRRTYDTWIEESHYTSSETTAVTPSEDIEPDPPAMRMLVDLQNVCMRFPKAEVNAVDGVGLKLYEDEIFALLGHNGAGKSTVLHILTGLISPTSGYGTVAGYDLINEMSSIRQHIGVCPQYDIQHEELTVAEHIHLFAGIKGLWAIHTRTELEEMVTKVLNQLDLESKRNEFVKALSGGQKRKLSVAMAIVGDPKILILDEPTAGMDAVSRRALWAVLTGSKKGRVTFLTTHMMDEADLVADRKAILTKGKIRCIGTSVFLKHRFNIGYQLNIAYPRASSNDLKITSLVNKYVPSATLLASSAAQPRHTVITPTTGENTLAFSIPPSYVSNFPRLFSSLDKQVKSGGISYYGLSMPSLEEVFLKSEGGVGSNETSEEARIAEEHWTRVTASEVVDEETLLLGNENVLHAVPVFSQFISLIHARWLMFGRSLSSTIPGILFPIYMFYPLFADDISSSTISFCFITMSLYFTAVSWARETVQERFQKIDSFLKTMGVSSGVYWGTNLAAQFPLMFTPGLVVCWLVSFWEIKAFCGAGFGMFFLANGAFAALALVSSYLLGQAYSDPGSFLTASSFYIMFGAILPYFSLLYFDTMGDPFWGSVVHTTLSFTVPPYPFSSIIYHMAMASAKESSKDIPPLTPGYYFAWEHKMLPSLIGMIFQSCLYFSLVLWIDGAFRPDERTLLNAEELELPVDRGDAEGDEDLNVVAERRKVVKPLCTEDVLLRRVRKVYPKGKEGRNVVVDRVLGRKGEELVAVRDLSLSCAQGEVVALLGPNGAGKTTAMSMAVGDVVPTRGAVAITTLQAQYPPQNVLARASLFGQVAQHDTLWPLLTAREHLNLIASLKGIVQKRRSYWIRMLVDAMGSSLTSDMDKHCKQLSGGTKRKVAFLMALVGKPKILFLDEPSTGVDPKAKRNLWNLLKALQGRLATLLTTHSMEEADALATRIGIVVEGQLACLGTQQYLKTTYGKGFLLEVHTQSDEGVSAGSVTQLVEASFANAVLKERFEDILARWEIPEQDVIDLGGLGRVFEVFEGAKTEIGGFKEFCFGQMSLEMVFLKFVKKEEGVADIE
ncbi:ATP-binding cassette sub- A member 5 [Rhizoclosmatium sp. JEL0117]|nr:ATP-binding cassette sub- A member 5 [Rhizoclosmatium sp. JEL0117]